MHRLFSTSPLAVLVLLYGGSTAYGQSTSSSQPSSSQQKPAADPDERICEDVTQTGSRLATKRFCATRAEWEDKKRQDREAVEKAQMSPCVLTHNGSGGKPGC